MHVKKTPRKDRAEKELGRSATAGALDKPQKRPYTKSKKE